MTINDHRDSHIDRCPGCGGWRWRQQCPTCLPEDRYPGAITQSPLPPYVMYCHGCGKRWEARPARGKAHPTAASIDRECETHYRECPARGR